MTGVQTCALPISLSTLAPLSGNKFYFHEVINFEVIDGVKGNIGKIKQILDYPTQAIFEIINAENKEILIPITDEIISKVDRANQKIEIATPEGLIDLYLE